MSGIYGFFLRGGDAMSNEHIMGGLEYWNRIYGRDAVDQKLFENAGIGCHIEHFSETFSYGGPVLTVDGGAAVMDALLYNRDELELELGLEAKCGLSDEELLMKLIQEKGYDALARVNGDFCGAVYDSLHGTWTIFRDHLGVRPLYYYLDERIFVFSTDIRGIASVEGVDLRVNREKLFARLNFCNHLSLQQTDYEYIRCALPGAVTHVSPAQHGFALKEKPYWKLRSRRVRMDGEAAYAGRMRELVEDSVRRRLEAIPGLVGAELSGGLDSSVIDILINRNGRKGCYYSWSRDPEVIPYAEGRDERKVIRDVCRQEGIECRYLYANDGACTQGMYDRVVPSFVNTVELSFGSRWMRSQGARVIFTGHGGDEGVSHRGSRFELFYNGELLQCYKLYRKDLEGRSFASLKAIYSACFEVIRRWRSMDAPLYSTDMHSEILDQNFNDQMKRTFRNEPLYFSVSPWRYVLQGGTRNRLDNVAYQGAAAGVRYLLPFVDYRVMDFAVSVPRHLYVSNEGNRILYRNAFRDLMPPSLAAVNYKEFLSMANVKWEEPPMDVRKQELEQEREFLTSRLDAAYWKGILDLDAVAQREEPEDSASSAARSFRYDTRELYRCILIQNTALMAKNWRDIDEQPDLL